jgi:N-methylhydantoinase A
LPYICKALSELQQRAQLWIDGESIEFDLTSFVTTLDLRYLGQSSELNVPVGKDRPDQNFLSAAVAAFHTEHTRRFGYAMVTRPVELVTVRLAVKAHRGLPPTERSLAGSAQAVPGTRPVWFHRQGFITTPVHDRCRLAVGAHVPGPAIIEQMDATTVVPPDWGARVDAASNLIIEHVEAT